MNNIWRHCFILDLTCIAWKNAPQSILDQLYGGFIDWSRLLRGWFLDSCRKSPACSLAAFYDNTPVNWIDNEIGCLPSHGTQRVLEIDSHKLEPFKCVSLKVNTKVLSHSTTPAVRTDQIAADPFCFLVFELVLSPICNGSVNLLQSLERLIPYYFGITCFQDPLPQNLSKFRLREAHSKGPAAIISSIIPAFANSSSTEGKYLGTSSLAKALMWKKRLIETLTQRLWAIDQFLHLLRSRWPESFSAQAEER